MSHNCLKKIERRQATESNPSICLQEFQALPHHASLYFKILPIVSCFDALTYLLTREITKSKLKSGKTPRGNY